MKCIKLTALYKGLLCFAPICRCFFAVFAVVFAVFAAVFAVFLLFLLLFKTLLALIGPFWRLLLGFLATLLADSWSNYGAGLVASCLYGGPYVGLNMSINDYMKRTIGAISMLF